MKLYEVQNRDEALLASLLQIWEGSVRATHLFLTEKGIARIKGLGRQLLQYGRQHYGVRELTVNE